MNGGYRCFKGLCGIVFWGCFSGSVVTGVSRDWVYGVWGVFQWIDGYRCFKRLGGIVLCFVGVSWGPVVGCYRCFKGLASMVF